MTTSPDLIAAGRAAEPTLFRVARDGEAATVTLSDPRRLNRLSPGLMAQVREALDGSPDVRRVVVPGEGALSISAAAATVRTGGAA